jgi:hypothetical protein
MDGVPFLVVEATEMHTANPILRVASKQGLCESVYADELDKPTQRTITIGGVEVPEPEREPLCIGQQYWVVDLASNGPATQHWGDSGVLDCRWLERGMIHLTEENAQAHTDAIYRANKGETE